MYSQFDATASTWAPEDQKALVALLKDFEAIDVIGVLKHTSERVLRPILMRVRETTIDPRGKKTH